MTPRGPLIAALCLPLLSTACTLIVDRSADQCESDADCAAFPGTACSKDNVCAPPPCNTNADCTPANTICVQRDHLCASLLSAECTTIEGDYKNKDALILGSILPTSQTAGVSIENGIRLAIHDFEQTSNGLPPVPGETAPRPLVLVGCNDNSDADTAVAAASHLVDLGLPAIIGAAYSGITIRMATEVTIPGGVLAISPSATSAALTDLSDNNLVWRTSPSDIYQAQAMDLYLPQVVEPDVRATLSLMPGDKVKVTILNKGDSYGSGLGKAVEKDLILNGAPALDTSNAGSYVRFDYGDPDDAQNNPTKYDQAVTQVLDDTPHILIILGTTEVVTDLLKPIEDGWPSGLPYRPTYVLSDGGVVNELWETVGTDDALRRRVTGTIPGTTNILFNAFRSEYNSQFMDGTSPDVFGSAGAYDATYLLAYGAVSLGAEPITGPALVESLKKMVPPGATVDVGTDAINGTLMTLANGGSINFNGASGPLDFDVTTGEAPSDIQIWCMPKGVDGSAQSAIGSGLYLDAGSNALQGTIGAVCN